MDRVKIELKNCYGIKDLSGEFDFTKKRAYAIYAPNGAMKSSLAQTFQDVAAKTNSLDRLFPARPTTRKIKDEKGNDVAPEQVMVVLPYNEDLAHTEKTSTLLVDAKLRKEYDDLNKEIDKAKEALLAAIKKQSGSSKDFAQEISSAFTSTNTEFVRALIRIKAELQEQKETPFATVAYDRIFDDKVVTALETNDLKSAIEEYVTRYNELLAKSTYFKKGTFDYYNANEIAKSLTNNGFFDANHTVNLNAEGKKLEITTEKQLAEIIAKEKEAILTDSKLRRKFDDVAKKLSRNVNLRDFEEYMMQNEPLLSRLANLKSFKEDILKSYLRVNHGLYLDFMSKHEAAEQRRKKIEEEAKKQRTQWEKVIDIFNARFIVPFTLTAKNREAVLLGQARVLELGFAYNDGADRVEIDRAALLKSLSTGEKRAFYILNVLFEIETRIKANQETLVVIDDIADSFDYQNKYAIIQYLKDISENGLFKQIVLTHNFDFFRTIESRFVGYSHCLMASKTGKGIVLGQATGIRNIFVNDWKLYFFKDPKKKIASIPFLRNLVEFTEGVADPKYLKLTSLLHWKPDTSAITVADLDQIYNAICKPVGKSADGKKLVWEMIDEQAKACLAAPAGMNFENKIVLAIAIRLTAERFMVKKINDPAFVTGIKEHQTQALAAKFKSINPDDKITEVLDRVLLMTPENIHLNSFMYEPIIDMSDEQLKKLFAAVSALS